MHVAMPPLNAALAHNVPAPSLKLTVPVGEVPVTVAVNVTLCANVLGLLSLARTTLLLAFVTVMELLGVDAGPAPAALFATTVNVYVPAGSGSNVMLVHGALHEANAPPGLALAV